MYITDKDMSVIVAIKIAEIKIKLSEKRQGYSCHKKE
jgi:hypothetical protein